MKRYAKQVRLWNKANIQKRIESGERFSVTTDEYTSTQNKRYSNVSLHPAIGRPIKIGMIRIRGSLPGVKAAAELKKKLNEYDLKEEIHTVALTTDAASVMKKMGRKFRAMHQLCFSHGIHLAGIVQFKFKYSGKDFLKKIFYLQFVRFSTRRRARAK